MADRPVGALSDVLTSAAGSLGVTGFADSLDLGGPAAICVVLVDGLGWRLLCRHVAARSEQIPTLAGLAATGRPLRVGFPSSTPISLTSLGTGVGSGAHGMLGLQILDRERDRLLNPLRWSKDEADPLVWQPRPTVFERVVAAGTRAVQVAPSAFSGAPFTAAAFRGAQFVGADTRGEVVAAAAAACVEPALVYVYDGALDSAGHHHGCGSAAWRHELDAVDDLLRRLRRALPPATRLVVVGDHGMLDVPDPCRIDLDADPALLQGIRHVGGEPRARHLYCEPGAAAPVRDRFAALTGASASVLLRDEAVAAGWFGPDVSPLARPRIGDVVVAAIGEEMALVRPVAEPYVTSMRGMHGGLTDDETLVPLLVG